MAGYVFFCACLFVDVDILGDAVPADDRNVAVRVYGNLVDVGFTAALVRYGDETCVHGNSFKVLPGFIPEFLEISGALKFFGAGVF